MAGPLAAIGLAASAVPNVMKTGTGIMQMIAGKRALDDLEGQEPDIYTPSAFRQRVIEPVAESRLAALDEGAQRRTGQSVGALQRGGSRALIGGLNSVLDSERRFNRQTQAKVDQARNQALSQLASADMTTQRRRDQRYQGKLSAARNLVNAGSQNVVGAAESQGQFGQQLAMGDMMGYLDGASNKAETFGDMFEAPSATAPDTRGLNKINSKGLSDSNSEVRSLPDYSQYDYNKAFRALQTMPDLRFG